MKKSTLSNSGLRIGCTQVFIRTSTCLFIAVFATANGSLVVISIFLYACETWTLTAELEKKIQTTEMRCFRRLLGISYRDHVTNEKVGNRIRQAIGPYEDLLTPVKKRQVRWYGHKTRSTGLAKMILQGTVQGGRRRGRQKKRWEDNVTEWTGLKLGEALRKAKNRRMENSGCPIILGAPTVK